ncbi:MAG: hypothetical protein EOP04_29595, partial [Proteobacteria bacterium]
MATSEIRFSLLTGPKTAEEIAATIGVSQPTFSRLFKASQDSNHLRSFGTGKSTKYAALRTVLGDGPDFPLFLIDEYGQPRSLGELTAVERGSFIHSASVKKNTQFAGIPYFLSDARPAGYLGRGFATRNADLGYPVKITDWSEDQV